MRHVGGILVVFSADVNLRLWITVVLQDIILTSLTITIARGDAQERFRHAAVASTLLTNRSRRYCLQSHPTGGGERGLDSCLRRNDGGGMALVVKDGFQTRLRMLRGDFQRNHSYSPAATHRGMEIGLNRERATTRVAPTTGLPGPIFRVIPS